MSVARPSSPATLSLSDALAVKLQNAWLVDATSGATVPDITVPVTGPDLIVTGGVTYANTAPLGRQLVGNGSGAVIASLDYGNALSAPITSFPFSLGAIFCYTGTKSGGSGPEIICAIADGGTPSGSVFCLLFIDDGTYTAAGHVTALFRVSASDTIRTADAGAFTSGAQQAVALHVDSNTIEGLYLDGAKSTAGSGSAGFLSQTFGTAGMLGYTVANNSGALFYQASSKMGVAFHWLSVNSGVDDTVCANWTADPWTVLTPSGGGGAVYSRQYYDQLLRGGRNV